MSVSSVCCRFFAARCYASAAYAVMRCVCVCLSLTFVHSVKTNKHVFNFFTTLVFPYQTAGQYSDWSLPLTGRRMQVG